MRVSQQEMEKSHRRILHGAARLVRERGIENTSVNDVMGDAGMKNGGFYRHFESKEALIDASLQAAFDQVIEYVEAHLNKHGPEGLLAGYRSYYLSPGHVEHPGTGCPVAALAGDVGRGPDSLKASFGAGLKRMVETLSKAMPGSAREKKERAMREFASLVGAVVIARASDPETARAVLAACRRVPKEG